MESGNEEGAGLAGTGWEDVFRSWSGPPSNTEAERRDRIERAIREALVDSGRVPSADTSVYSKGSYAKNTNVRLDSDVDVGVERTENFYYDRAGGAESVPLASLGIHPAVNLWDRYGFKDDVEAALVAKFGSSAVARKNRCLTVRETGSSLAADVVPCFNYRYFVGTVGVNYEGAVIWPDDGSKRIVNYPRIDLDNGRAKNNATSRRYKALVRILKRLENEMVDKGLISAVASYLMECLVYSVPNQQFGTPTFEQDFRNVLSSIYTLTEPGSAASLTEVNGLKFLFRPAQRWNAATARSFVEAAWSYYSTGRG